LLGSNAPAASDTFVKNFVTNWK